MLQQILAGGGILATLFAVVWLALKHSRSSGKKEGAAEATVVAADQHNKEINANNAAVAAANEQRVKDVEQVHEIHDKLTADPTYRKRVRDRFTRED